MSRLYCIFWAAIENSILFLLSLLHRERQVKNLLIFRYTTESHIVVQYIAESSQLYVIIFSRDYAKNRAF